MQSTSLTILYSFHLGALERKSGYIRLLPKVDDSRTTRVIVVLEKC